MGIEHTWNVKDHVDIISVHVQVVIHRDQVEDKWDLVVNEQLKSHLLFEG